MRLFIAIPVSEDVRSHARELISDLKKSRAAYKWVEPENLHLTLAFLGETAEDKVPALETILEQAAAGKPPFSISFGALGAFDSFHNPRILWIGITEGAARLKELAGALHGILSQAGFPTEDREFKPHLTIARMRSFTNVGNLKARLGHWSDPSRLVRLHSPADRLALYESRLSPKGPQYTLLKEAALHA